MMQRSPPMNKTLSASDSNIKPNSNNGEDISQQDISQLNITMRDKRRRLSDESYDELTAFKMEMKEMLLSFQESQNKRFELMNRHLEELKIQNSSIFTTNQEIEHSLDDVSQRLQAMQSKIDGMEAQRKEIINQISNIDEKFDFLEKSLKKTSIELRFIPRIQKETKDTLFGYINQLSQSFNISLHPGDLRDVYRVPNKNDPLKSTVIAEFSNTQIKTKFLNTARHFSKAKDLKISNLGIENNNSALYISESLTAKSRRLHFLARDVAKSKNFKYCWTSNGNVYLRREEGSEYILIKNEAQLMSLSKSE